MAAAGILYFEVVSLTIPACRQCEIEICTKFGSNILDFQVMRIWPLRRVDSVASVFCTKFGSNICYSH